jgi:hypothetical protein
MHAYSQAITDVTYTYTIDLESKDDFKDSDQVFEIYQGSDFEYDLELS